MADFDYFEFYKELYHKENERRVEIDGSFSIPLAIVSAIVAGMYILITSLPSEAGDMICISFYALLGLSFIAVACAVYNLILAFMNGNSFLGYFFRTNRFDYKAIPYPQGLRTWQLSLEQYYRLRFPNTPNIKSLVDDDFNKFLIDQFADATSYNTFVNDKKLAKLFNCKKFLIPSVILNALALLPFMYAITTKSDEVHKVEIQNKSYTLNFQEQTRYTDMFFRKSNPIKRHSFQTGSILPNVRCESLNGTGANIGQNDSLDVSFNANKSFFDNSGKPAPPKGRILIEGETPEKPLNYKKK